MSERYRQQALDYHERPTPGKISIQPTKECRTATDLSLAYTPGVAEPCLEIAKNPDDVYRYTSRGNLVAVISNGTRVLGLGDIGPAAAKPVMEGKGILFKRFADVDVFDIELDTKDVDEFVRTVEILSPTFGGINLEDIRAPDCFEIEARLKESLSIPVFHDDQHGTALIAAAGLLNALRIQEKTLEEAKVVVAGAGAAGLAIAHLLRSLGLPAENLLVCDSRGVLRVGRDAGMTKWKEPFRRETELKILGQAMVGADACIAVSEPGSITAEMVKDMAPRPILFALSNPDPEILPDDAHAVRDDLIMATGRSDFPNQVNNVLGFPFIFRGALDVAATGFNEEMKRAAVDALARLAREPVPEEVSRAYDGERFEFGPEYIIPKPFDPRVLTWVAPAVARAAIESGVARKKIEDWEGYRAALEKRFGMRLQLMRGVKARAKQTMKRIVFPEASSKRVLQAVGRIVGEGFAHPILLGDPEVIQSRLDDLGISGDIEIVDPVRDSRAGRYASTLFQLRGRRGGSLQGAREAVKMGNTFGSLMVHEGDADALVTGARHTFPEAFRPALQIIGLADGSTRVSGVHMIAHEGRLYFFADTSVNIEPDAEELAQIALNTAQLARFFHIEPKVAMLSFSTFGSVHHPAAMKVERATEIVRQRAPDLPVEGEIAPDVALSPEVVKGSYPQSVLRGDANVLVFPDLSSGNLAYKIVEQLAGAEVVGPILMGFAKPVCVLPQGATVENIVHMAALLGISTEEASTFGLAKEG